MIKYIVSDNPYKFDMDKNGFPVLTENNVKRVNFLIANDSNYSLLDDQYEDSISQTINKFNKDRYTDDKEEILKIVEVIDRQNSTHLSFTGMEGDDRNGGRRIMAEFICKLTKTGFYDSLRASDPELVNLIAKNAIKTRNTFSFASKLCTYMARALFKGEKEEDNYSIFDSVMCNALPYYAWAYLKENHVKKKCSTIPEEFAAKGNGNYEGYRKLIDRIRDSALDRVVWDTTIETNYISNNEIWDKRPRKYYFSRREFDHLLWYYFKGSSNKDKIQKALSCVGKVEKLLE